MKLILAIVHDDDGPKVMDELNKNGFMVTKLCSTGGFLRAGNTTLLAGVEESSVDTVIDIITKSSKSHKQMINSQEHQSEKGGKQDSKQREVVVGGATIFVLDIENFEKV